MDQEVKNLAQGRIISNRQSGSVDYVFTSLLSCYSVFQTAGHEWLAGYWF
jgi:hypothetical protein